MYSVSLFFLAFIPLIGHADALLDIKELNEEVFIQECLITHNASLKAELEE